MEHNSTESGTPDNSDGEESTVEISFDEENLLEYLQTNPTSTNVKLFSFLALLNAYVPESYLRMCECQQVLGPPDPIHGGPPFKERMRPFTDFINTSSPNEIHIIHPEIAWTFENLLEALKITRSTTVKNFMSSLCGNPTESYIVQFIRDLLLKREMGENGREKFSALITDILEKENFYNAVSVLKTASHKFRMNPNFPQTISRLYYINRCDYDRAERWAEKAIQRAPDNSYMADTLGQIYKNRLMKAKQRSDVIMMVRKAFKAFKDVEQKAGSEEGPQKEDVQGVASISNSFNNRGLFGFIQIAKLAFEKLGGIFAATLHPNLKMEVEAKFDFFEWYLTYSKIDMTTSEPNYFWKDVALCYKYYTTKTAAESTSFPGLLDCLNHGLFTSKGSRAGFLETEKTASALETIRDVLKTDYEANADDVKVAERYVLSNILLSNKRPDSPQLTPVTELQTILYRFLGREDACRRPEFCLLVLLLFWPEEQLQVTQEEEDGVDLDVTAEDWSEIPEDEDTDKETVPEGEPSQQSPEIMLDPDLGKYVTLMERAYERAKYAKYLRGRYLLTLFYLGKGSGLSRWIHKSRLDAIVEKKVDLELANERHETDKKKVRRINNIWLKGQVWHIPQIKDILLPVRVEPCRHTTTPQEHEKQEVFVCAGEKKIKARIEPKADGAGHSPMLYYLGFTIQGPVVFKVEAPHNSEQ